MTEKWPSEIHILEKEEKFPIFYDLISELISHQFEHFKGLKVSEESQVYDCCVHFIINELFFAIFASIVTRQKWPNLVHARKGDENVEISSVLHLAS